MSAPLYRLVYRSESFLGGDAATRAEREQILGRSRVNNARAGVTGVLTWSGAVVLQVLEGALPDLERTFERICCDLRHSGVTVLELAAVDERLFEGWAMAEIAPETQTEALLSLLFAHDRGAPSGELTEAAVRLMATLTAVSARNEPAAAAA